MIQTKQTKLIGNHPSSPSIFFEWLNCYDIPITTNKCHRKLNENSIDEEKLIKQFSDWIIKHHTKDTTLEKFRKKKGILEKHNFKKYVKERLPIPIKNKSTQKGNFGEIILAEYLVESSALQLLIYKFHFNPNIEQAMKGDDVLLFDKENVKNKMIMGEAKFRESPYDKKALIEIVDNLAIDKLPISLTFIMERLEELQDNDLANQIDDLISDVHNKTLPIIYVGFLMSSEKIHNLVECHLNSNNQDLLFISLSCKEPLKIIESSFQFAEKQLVGD